MESYRNKAGWWDSCISLHSLLYLAISVCLPQFWVTTHQSPDLLFCPSSLSVFGSVRSWELVHEITLCLLKGLFLQLQTERRVDRLHWRLFYHWVVWNIGRWREWGGECEVWGGRKSVRWEGHDSLLTSALTSQGLDGYKLGLSHFFLSSSDRTRL